MDRYLVISPHTEQDCKQAIKDVYAAGYITHFDWGCMDGDHTGWVTIDAENAGQALLVVPTSHRRTARAVKLVKFSLSDVEKLHL
jgi:hypothetical protein